MSCVAEVLEVSRSQLHMRASGLSKSRGSYRKAEDADLLSAIRRLVDQRPTYGYRLLTALLNRNAGSVDLSRSTESACCASLASTA